MDTEDRYVVALDERGGLVLPTALRQRLNLRSGDQLLITVDTSGGFRAISAHDQARQLCGLYRELVPGRSLADELIAERREEARREDAR
jgi:bifunctional DNA-binding transcriptional regulator/antitoxin component of YhaV-PrlF toxin-antitoxin module